MKDLFVFVADADAEAIMKTILRRHQSLNLRPITFDVDRHPMRDNGMVRDGPELLRYRLRKTDYDRVLLIWDYEGSGQKGEPEECEGEVRTRLESASWSDRCAAVVVVPELEEWLWHNQASIAKLLKIGTADLDKMLRQLPQEPPKERFERVVYQHLRRKPLPEDFEQLAKSASLVQWRNSSSFSSIADTLRTWFPAKP